MLDKCTLVLEGVTLAGAVEFVIKVLVNLSRSTVLDEKAAKDSETTHPQDLAMIKFSLASQTLKISKPKTI